MDSENDERCIAMPVSILEQFLDYPKKIDSQTPAIEIG